MIQRIQTVFLLIVIGLMVSMLFFPLAIVSVATEFYKFDVLGVYTMLEQPTLVYPTWGLFVLVAIIAVLNFVIIFLFKNRVLQMRMCLFNILLMLGFYGFFAYLSFQMNNIMQVEAVDMNYKLTLCFPFIGIILNYLAIRKIGADETLIRSLDRLR